MSVPTTTLPAVSVENAREALRLVGLRDPIARIASRLRQGLLLTYRVSNVYEHDGKSIEFGASDAARALLDGAVAAEVAWYDDQIRALGVEPPAVRP